MTTDPAANSHPSWRPLQGNSWIALLVLSMALGSAIAGFSPADTDALDLIARLVFWVAHVVVGAALCLGLEQLSMHGRRNRPFGLMPTILCALIASVLFTPFAWQMEVTFGLTSRHPPWADAWLQEWRQVVIPFVLSWLLLRSRAQWRTQPSNHFSPKPTPSPRDHRPAPSSTSPQDPSQLDSASRRFWDQVPGGLDRKVIWVRADEHYLHVQTPQGKALVRSSLRAAIQGPLSACDGIQVHRSCWVSLTSVKALVTMADRWFVLTQGGEQIPVSRRRRAAVRQALAARFIYPRRNANLHKGP